MLEKLAHDLVLENKWLRLEPLCYQHLDQLLLAASDGELWNLHFTGVPSADSIEQWYATAVAEREQGRQLPFAVRRLDTDTLVGSSRFYDINAEHRNLAIGYTWYALSAQRTFVNSNCKLLLLEHAFELCGCIAVYWHTHHENFASQRAILRLGAQADGIIRNHQIDKTGRLRHTHCFSMIDEEKKKGIVRSF